MLLSRSARRKTFGGGAMHPFVPHNPNPLHVASQAERLARQEHGTWGLVFQGITAVSLAVVTSKMLLDMLRDSDRRKTAARAGSRRVYRPGRVLLP